MNFLASSEEGENGGYVDDYFPEPEILDEEWGFDESQEEAGAGRR